MARVILVPDSVRLLALYGGKSKRKDSLGVSGRFDIFGTSDATEGGISWGDGRGGGGRGARKHPFERIFDAKLLAIEFKFE